MACKKCDFKGYQEDFVLMNDAKRSVAKQCDGCNDIEAYSRYVMGLEPKSETPEQPSDGSAKIIQFPARAIVRRVCPDCQGKGGFSGNCRACGGSGKV